MRSAHCLADGGPGTDSKAIPGGADRLGTDWLCSARQRRR